MKRVILGRSGLEVTEFCLGTMTWGSAQNDEADAHAQLDRALERGINFLDTAEMYPVNPVRAETVGRTEAYIGSWIAKSGRRDEYVIATKMAGFNERFVRQGEPVTGATLRRALEGSLRRLNTDWIDLYQLHWPSRGSFHFRQNWAYDPSSQDAGAERAAMAETMETLKDLVAEGKIRAFGLSNESTWGTMSWLAAAEATGGPPVVTIQNEYSLMCRQFDTDLAEMSHNEGVTLLAFSPLATGFLSEKYLSGEVPKGSRMELAPDLSGRVTDRSRLALAAYADIAARHGLSLPQMALAWTRTRPVPVIPIFGATTLEQLDMAIGAAEITLSDEVLDEIAATHRLHPMPF